MIKHFIPLGDHCVVSILLKEIGIRKNSFPFDWTVHKNQLYETNINFHFDLIEKIIKNEDINTIIKKYIGEKTEIQNNIFNSIWFAHDLQNETYEEMYEKYERRFIRLKNIIFSKEPIFFIMVLRKGKIEITKLKKNIEYFINLNKENKFFLFSGNEDQKKDLENIVNNNFIYQFIPYESENLYEYDQKFFRPKLLDFFKLYFNE